MTDLTPVDRAAATHHQQGDTVTEKTRADLIAAAAVGGTLAGEDVAAAEITGHAVGCMCPQCDAARIGFAAGRQSAVPRHHES